MRKLLFSPLVLLALNTFGQMVQPSAPQTGPEQKAPLPPDINVTIQIGTDTLKNGTDTVKFSPGTLEGMQRSKITVSYIVMLTPIGECGQLSVAQKKEKYFIVKQQKNSGSLKASFDYMVTIKQTKPPRPQRPQMPPPPPQQGGVQSTGSSLPKPPVQQ